MAEGETRRCSILLVEDNPADERLVREAFREIGLTCDLAAARDGRAALELLRGGGGEPPLRPDLIIADLDMPGMDGRQLMVELKNDAQLRRIPLIVLSASQAESDVARTYDQHGNCFVRKPLELEDLIGVVESVRDFWLNVAELPRDPT